MRLAKYLKEPGERKRYILDYSDWLDTGETITNVSFSVSPAESGGLTIDASSIGPTANTVVFFASLGLSGTTYTAECVITTSTGQVKEDQIVFAVREY